MADSETTPAARFELNRFVEAQEDGGAFDRALVELRAGRKTTHWSWFVFPQLRGLGRSATAEFFGIASLDEARAYLEHGVLGPRLLQAMRAAADAPADSAVEVMGAIDALKLRSSATLFHFAAPDEPVFQTVLDRWYGGVSDPATESLLL